MDSLLQGMTAEDIAALVSGLAAFLVVVLVWNAFVERDPLPARLKALSQRRETLKADLTRTARRSERKGGQMSVMRRVVERFKLARGKTAEEAVAKLLQAGYRQKDALTVYLFLKAVLPLAMLAGAATLVYGTTAIPATGVKAVLVCLVAGYAGARLPDLLLSNKAQKRQAAIRMALPDAFDLLVICAEAGLSLDSAFERVSREMGEGCRELADEIGLTSVELGFLPDRAKALQGFADRVPLPGVKALVTTLAQTERYGTPLAQALRVLASEMRTERMLRAEEKAARLPAIMTLPLMLFILPPLFIVLVGPAGLKIADSFGKM